MALRGNLRDFSLPDVFQLVTLSGKSGVLRIKRADAEGSVWFRDGEVFFAQSDWHREPLGTRLVAAGKITPSALSRALGVQRAEMSAGRRLGQILVDEGFTTDRVLEAFVQEQIQDTIFDLFRWDEGDFDFETLEGAPEEDIGLSVSIENIVMEGSRRLEEWTRIKKKIPSMDIVFKMATAPGEGTFDISLKPVEWSLLLKIDGTRSVAELARELSRTDFEVARIIYGLFSAGLLEVASDEEVGRLRAGRTELEAAIAEEASGPAREPVAENQPAPVPPQGPAVAEHVVEEPVFLSAGQAAPSADDMAVFEQMMGAVLEAPEATPWAGAETRTETPFVEPEPEPELPARAVLEPAEAGVREPASVFEPVVEAPVPLDETPIEPEPEPEPEPAPEPMPADLADLLATLETEQPRSTGPAEELYAVAVPGEGESPARTGDFAADLMALGLGELPTGDLLAPTEEPVSEPEPEPEFVAEPAPALEPEPIEVPGLEEFMASASEWALEPMAETALEVEDEPASISASGDIAEIADLLSSFGAAEDEQPLLDTSAALANGISEPEAAAAPSGAISTNAFLTDFDGTDGSFSSGLGDEITALTGGGMARTRPMASAARTPERDSDSMVLHRDGHVDRDLVMRIIEGVKRL